MCNLFVSIVHIFIFIAIKMLATTLKPFSYFFSRQLRWKIIFKKDPRLAVVSFKFKVYIRSANNSTLLTF